MEKSNAQTQRTQRRVRQKQWLPVGLYAFSRKRKATTVSTGLKKSTFVEQDFLLFGDQDSSHSCTDDDSADGCPEPGLTIDGGAGIFDDLALGSQRIDGRVGSDATTAGSFGVVRLQIESQLLLCRSLVSRVACRVGVAKRRDVVVGRSTATRHRRRQCDGEVFLAIDGIVPFLHLENLFDVHPRLELDGVVNCTMFIQADFEAESAGHHDFFEAFASFHATPEFVTFGGQQDQTSIGGIALERKRAHPASVQGAITTSSVAGVLAIFATSAVSRRVILTHRSIRTSQVFQRVGDVIAKLSSVTVESRHSRQIAISATECSQSRAVFFGTQQRGTFDIEVRCLVDVGG